MATTSLSAALPAPRYSNVTVENDEGTDDAAEASSSTALATKASHIPPYGKRTGWKPRAQADFGDGGSYPECHIAQYPLEMGRKKAGTSGNTVALQVDADGTVRYDAIVQQGRRPGQIVQSSFKDLVPLSQREGKDKERGFERPSEEEVMSTAERTRLALEKITQGKIKATQPKNVAVATGKQAASYIRYTPGQGDGGKQRIIKMTEVAEDPLQPPRHRFGRQDFGPPSPPPPVLRSPPRKVTAEELKEWNIPPDISNWKNNKGYTIPLDKRLAADGRGLQDVHINDGFAQFSEALNLADRHAREEVRQRSIMQQKLAAKEKAAREEHLRNLAQRARDERAGIASVTPSVAGGDDRTGDTPSAAAQQGRVTGAAGGSMPAALAGYGSDSSGSGSGSDSDSEEDEAARERDRIRAERKRERERDLRMSNMGTEQRAKMLAKEQNRDISEKVALGLAKPTTSKESMMDSRLFNQEKLSSGYGEEDGYNLYDKPLFQGSSAAAAIYSRPAGKSGGVDNVYGGGTAEGFDDELKNDRFGLGTSRTFEGAEPQEARAGPVQFEKDASDPFAINQFLDDAKRGTKRSGLESAEVRKRQRDDEE
ncbi:related to transcriptional coregulator Snw1 [Pseudozyma flocculosa]|uniref:Pre-mRNA-processing protein 45 n=1 Tax=Pseudozyma flocculosa TaxID=84751 RepID=A0A5C3EYQ6_9BASI|nr:related to transcriptional coregulator Snw1 [Pseudozyma flocculosa]